MKKIYRNFNPLISVIINCYNGEKYLTKAINSVLKQSYKNLEIIFWDNFSEDKSKKILNSFKDKRIKYYKSKKFTKLYEARNLAIKKAKGEFIAFLDVDDFWSPLKLEKQIKIFYANKKLTLVYSDCFIIRNKNQSKKIFANTKLPTGKITQNLLNFYRLPILTVLIKKKAFRYKKFNKNYDIIGDFDFFVNLSLKSVIGCAQEPLAHYRIHKNNISRTKLSLFIKELEDWVAKNRGKKALKKYSFKGIVVQTQLLKIKKNLLENFRIKALFQILKFPFNIKKLKFLCILFLPRFFLNKILSL